jgi:hypothetical protein
MNDLHTLLIALGASVLVVIILDVVLPNLKRRGVDVGALLDHSRDALTTANKILDTLRPFFEGPGNTDVFAAILDAVGIGVENAEQLYIIGKIKGTERKEAAREYILQAIGLVGIKPAPEIRKLIDGAIEAYVFSLGHKPKAAETPAAAEPG